MVGHARGVLREYYKVSFFIALVRIMVTNHDRTWIRGVTNTLRGKPLLDMVGGILEDYEYLWDEYYFSTAT